MGRYFIQLSYDGTEYFGWQRQPQTRTVEETITKVLTTLLREEIILTGCGRTDSGVSASDYYAHFDTDLTIEREFLVKRMNRMLPKDIVIKNIFPCGLHARFDAVKREYQYYISKTKNPFNRHLWTIEQKLDIGKMKEGCELLFHYDDFTSFAKLHGNALTNICTIYNARIDESDDTIIFTIVANRFLRGMVRAIVGTLVDVGRNKISVEQFKTIIESKDRSNASMQAPASGLFLTRITYPGF